VKLYILLWREIVALGKFKDLMAKHGGSLDFEAHGK